MICWDRCGQSGYVGVFSRHEITVLDSYVTGLLDLIEHRTASYAAIAVGAGREVHVPTAAAEDPRIIAILEDEVGVDEPDWVLTISEGPCLFRARDLLALMRSTMPGGDSVVHLRSRDEADAWLQCVQYFLSSITGAADLEGRVKGKNVIPTVTWLSEVSSTLRLAVARTVTV
ncbi:hypothetical protein [Lentzea sp.]|uniref:DUF2017 family protein n=1 Tax=Lentzea sp. TaxID=56099 RepID=UPI002BF03D4D|nr:hypothetical protein [Lentzea sp.]HUQ57780.1 hypothetical protein [Lentzea sp.]